MLFLAFDLSILGYLAGPRIGVWIYDLAHAYAGPGLPGLVTVIGDVRWAASWRRSGPSTSGSDRMFGYGLKYSDRFAHTHLVEIGKPRD